MPTSGPVHAPVVHSCSPDQVHCASVRGVRGHMITSPFLAEADLLIQRSAAAAGSNSLQGASHQSASPRCSASPASSRGQLASNCEAKAATHGSCCDFIPLP